MHTIFGNPDEGDWKLEHELERLLHPYELKVQRPTYPLHLVTLDDFDSLDLELNADIVDWSWNYDCESPTTRSFDVFLHRPDEIRKAFFRPLEVEVGKKVIVLITPNVIVTSKNLEVFSSQNRRCYYNWERQLKYFNIYTKGNCEQECFVNYTIAKCGCVKYSMPRKISHVPLKNLLQFFHEHVCKMYFFFQDERDTRVCDVFEMECYASALIKYNYFSNYTNIADYREKCNCLSSCADIEYIPESMDLKYMVQNMMG